MESEKDTIQDKSSSGIVMMLLASICFALMAAMIKFVRNVPVMEIVFIRSLPIIIIVPLIIRYKRIPLCGNNQPLLFLRCFFSTFGIISYFYTLTLMALTDAVTIKQLSTFFIIILARIFLKEKITLKQIYIFVFAFVGALLVVKPGLRLDILPAIIGILRAISTAGSYVSVRHLRLTEHPLVIVNYFGLITGIVSLTVLIMQRNFVIPDLLNLSVLILNGLLGMIGQIALTKAYQLAKANLVSLYLYLQIIYSTIFGIIVFKEIPDLFIICGAIIIISCGYLNYKFKLDVNRKEE